MDWEEREWEPKWRWKVEGTSPVLLHVVVQWNTLLVQKSLCFATPLFFVVFTSTVLGSQACLFWIGGTFMKGCARANARGEYPGCSPFGMGRTRGVVIGGFLGSGRGGGGGIGWDWIGLRWPKESACGKGPSTSGPRQTGLLPKAASTPDFGDVGGA